MLNFTKIENKSGTLEELGVKWAGEIQRNTYVSAYIGENRMGNYIDDLCSYDGNLYLGSDGNVYAVEWFFGFDKQVPACWVRVEAKNGLPFDVSYALMHNKTEYVQSVSVEHGSVALNPLDRWALRFRRMEDAIDVVQEIEYNFAHRFPHGSITIVLVLK